MREKRPGAGRFPPGPGPVTLPDADASIHVVVTAAVPSERAQIAIDAMRAGKDVVADKPGVTTTGQLSAVRDVQRETGRRYLVVFGERLGTPAMLRAALVVQEGRIGEVDESILHKSFELNFFGHQRVAQAAVRIMLAQGTGGALLFNVSKQAVNPGPDFGPYGLPKAAALFLMRQYALDYGADGIRANAVNADRIRSGLLTPEMIRSRAAARGVGEADYMAGNLLRREVTAEDVAQAFLHQALALKTTADVTTVDGGNINAILR